MSIEYKEPDWKLVAAELYAVLSNIDVMCYFCNVDSVLQYEAQRGMKVFRNISPVINFAGDEEIERI